MKRVPLNPGDWFNSAQRSIVALYNNKFKSPNVSLLEKKLTDLLTANFKLWRYEDGVRRKDIPDKAIANLKRKIDRENQKRHDLIDSIDGLLRENLEKSLKIIDDSLPMNSETPGSIFDRLTVLALRTYHLKREVGRKDVDKSYIERCTTILKEVKERTEDLLKCLEELMDDIYSGRKRLKSYRQHKLYNDPKLNPYLRK